MTIHVTSRRVALAAAGGLLAALTLSGAAQAITDTVFRYTTPKTGHFGIDVMAMAPDRTDAADDYLVSWSGVLGTGNALCFNTGVNLPNHDAVVGLVYERREFKSFRTTGSPHIGGRHEQRHCLPNYHR